MRILIGNLLLTLSLAAQSFTPISQIQGPGRTSPIAGQTVTTRGVVTGVRSAGFYMQSQAADADGDPLTSEGLYVFTRTAPPAAAVRGALVRVTGVVTEFRPAADTSGPTLTEFTGGIKVEAEGTAEIPEAVALTRGLVSRGRELDNLEAYEGMRVSTERLVVVSPTASNGVFIGVLPGTPRPTRLPGLTEFAERLRVDVTGQGGTRIEAAAGMTVSNLSGPLDFFSRMWTIVLDRGERVFTEMQPAQPLPAPTASEFTLANLNLLRFLSTDSQLAARTQKLSLLVRTILHLPDILTVEECGDLQVLETVAARINQDAVDAGLADPQYRAFLEEGNDGTGIDVGFLVKTARVEIRAVFQEGKDTQYIRPDGRPETLNDRPPLVLRALIAGRFPITVVANHLRSLTDIEDPVSGPRIRLKRQLQADYLRLLLQRRAAETPGEPMAALGDFNAFQFESMPGDDPLAILRDGPPAMTLLTDLLPLDQNASYVFNGAAQTLDHILVNRGLGAALSRIGYAHVNAGYPDSLRTVAARPERVSDHDAVMAYFTLTVPAFTAAGVYDLSTSLTGAVAPGSLIAVEGPGLRPGQAVTVDGQEVGTLLAGPGFVAMNMPSGLSGRAKLSIGGVEVELPVQAAVPGILSAQMTADSIEIHVTGLNGQEPAVTLGGLACEVLSVEAADARYAPGVTLVRASLPAASDFALVVTAAGHSSQPVDLRP